MPGDQNAMHQVARDEHERNREPVETPIDSETQRNLRQIKDGHDYRKGRFGDPVRLMRFNRWTCRGGRVHRS